MKNLYLALLLLTSVGCSSSAEIQRAWVDPEINDKGLSGTLVVAIAENKNSQISFENAFVEKLTASGVNAKAGHLIKTKKLVSEEIVKYAQEQKLDTVLVIHYAGTDEKQLYHRGATYYRLNHFYGRAYEVAHSPSYYSTNKQVMLVATLYETATKEVLWDAVSTAQQGGDPRELLSPFIASFVEQLKKDGLVK